LEEGPVLEVVEGLLDRITALRNVRLTGQTVLLVFLFCRVLPLMARLALMWEYLELGDQSAVAEGHLPEESVTWIAWMVLGSTSGEPTVDKGLAPSRC
jgi:hypothetical protein